MSNSSCVTGSCLCRGITYEISGNLKNLSHCHCSMCRKAHGAAFGTYATVMWKDFKITKGSELINRYRSSEEIERTFCGHCGSTLQFILDHQPGFGIAAGTFDDDPKISAKEHLWISNKAPWWDDE